MSFYFCEINFEIYFSPANTNPYGRPRFSAGNIRHLRNVGVRNSRRSTKVVAPLKPRRSESLKGRVSSKGEAFDLFCAHYRPLVLAATCDHLATQDASRLLQERWLALGAANVQIWHRKSEANSLRRERAIVAWSKDNESGTTKTNEANDVGHLYRCSPLGEQTCIRSNAFLLGRSRIGEPVNTPFGIGIIHSVEADTGNSDKAIHAIITWPPPLFEECICLLRDYISQWMRFPGIFYYTETGFALGAWCIEQRRKRRSGRMLPMHRNELDRLGFDWRVRSSPEQNPRKILRQAIVGVPAEVLGRLDDRLPIGNKKAQCASAECQEEVCGGVSVAGGDSYVVVNVGATCMAKYRDIQVGYRGDIVRRSQDGPGWVIANPVRLTPALPTWPYPVVWHGNDVVEVWFSPGSIGLTLTEHAGATDESPETAGWGGARIFRVGGFRRDGNNAILPGERCG